MKTVDEIENRIACLSLSGSDLFGFETGDLIEFLPFDKAKKFLKEETTEEKWNELKCPRPLTRDTIVSLIVDYMPFAWDKANHCRGLSAGRSLSHMRAWLWLIGADAAAETISDYTHYGKPQLRSICEALGVDWEKLDDGKWRNNEGDDPVGTFSGPQLEIPRE